MKAEIPKTYNPQEVEGRWYQWWESKGFFRADAHSPKPAFVMMMPPPNVTGSLHMGHMLNQTVHDVIARRKRMQGFNTLWMPGCRVPCARSSSDCTKKVSFIAASG